MLKVLPVLLLLLLIITTLNYLPIKRELLYKLNLSGDQTTSCCDIQELTETGDFDESADVALFNGQTTDYPKTSLAQSYPKESAQTTAVLGTTNATGEEKWIEVSLEQQKLRAWEGNNIVKEFSISSGKWSPTPKGTFYIWYKTRFQTMKGGSKELGTYYNLPNVPYNMFFKGGFGLHGAYWHNNFGHPMSHGCVNEPVANAKDLFEWAGPTLADNKNAVKASPENPGTKVFIH